MFTKMHTELRAHISYIREESVEKEYAKGEQKKECPSHGRVKMTAPKSDDLILIPGMYQYKRTNSHPQLSSNLHTYLKKKIFLKG